MTKPQQKRQRLESPVIPQSNLARQRRQKMSVKILEDLEGSRVELAEPNTDLGD
ncbi:uncharacterized protein HKW66_Vig0033100 [Vigna angularis]|uniref:Uncharacterized protein n=1 Tax=Phaseolus angularis TaxID=3914 RepID=A0A8T0LCI2_PHAAN|nr:uncharacterized protein HKW66_Vig0033100 [Vigna angularis]